MFFVCCFSVNHQASVSVKTNKKEHRLSMHTCASSWTDNYQGTGDTYLFLPCRVRYLCIEKGRRMQTIRKRRDYPRGGRPMQKRICSLYFGHALHPNICQWLYSISIIAYFKNFGMRSICNICLHNGTFTACLTSVHCVFSVLSSRDIAFTKYALTKLGPVV